MFSPVLITYRNKNGELMPYVGVVMAACRYFFFTLNNFVASRSRRWQCRGANGAMNLVARARREWLTPLLQYSEMVIHPPNLYAGYTDSRFVCVRAGALLARYPGENGFT